MWIDYTDRSEVERVSGQGLVPVLEDEGTVVFDSMEIVRHLERRRPDPPLFPADAGARQAMDGFIEWFNREWKALPGGIEAELSAAHPDHGRIEALSREMDAALDRFEAMVAEHDHLMGPEFSAADCAAFPFLKFALARDPADDELFHRVLDEHQSLGDRHPRLEAWIRRVDERLRA